MLATCCAMLRALASARWPHSFVCTEQGAEVVPQLQSGDMITSARLVSGDNHLALHEGQC